MPQAAFDCYSVATLYLHFYKPGCRFLKEIVRFVKYDKFRFLFIYLILFLWRIGGLVTRDERDSRRAHDVALTWICR